MKIDRTGPARPAAPGRRSEKAGKAQAGNFSEHMASDAVAPGGVSTVAPVRSVDSLLAIQEVDDATSGQSRARARQWGVDLLDQLEQLRIDIIGGVVSRQDLERIAAMVEQQRVRTDDPALSMVLDEIELRARVELAKYNRED